MKSKAFSWDAVVLFVAICMFSMSAWIGVNGLWVELPLLVHVLPEGWNLPSYFVIIIQVANISPFAYVILKKWKPNRVKEWIATCVVIVVGMISSFILIFTWDKTSYIGGELHSTAILVLSFFLSTVDCASSVIYLPYMARFKSSTYMTALYVGEGLSGLVPALFGLLQTAGIQSDGSQNYNNTIISNTTSNETTVSNTIVTNPSRFSVGVYFLILTLLLAVSLVSFLFINFHSYFERFKFESYSSRAMEEIASELSHKTKESAVDENSINNYATFPHSRRGRAEVQIHEVNQNESPPSSNNAQMSTNRKKLETKDFCKCIVLLAIVALINFLTNGIHASIISYACLPYGTMTYDLAVKLSVLTNPLVCFLTLFFVARRLSLIMILTTIGSLMVAYNVYLATLSPNPILKHEDAGKALAILSNVLLTACFSYAKVCISTVFSELGGERLLLYNGVFTQVGSLFGAIIGFLLVGVFNVFKSQ